MARQRALSEREMDKLSWQMELRAEQAAARREAASQDARKFLSRDQLDANPRKFGPFTRLWQMVWGWVQKNFFVRAVRKYAGKPIGPPGPWRELRRVPTRPMGKRERGLLARHRAGKALGIMAHRAKRNAPMHRLALRHKRPR